MTYFYKIISVLFFTAHAWTVRMTIESLYVPNINRLTTLCKFDIYDDSNTPIISVAYPTGYGRAM